MACPLVVSASIMLAIASISLPSQAVTDFVLTTLCSQTHNRDACKNIFNREPRASSADPSTLLLISIQLAMKQADGNYKTYSQLHGSTKDKASRNYYDKCVGLYKDMQANLKVAYDLTEQGKYEEITQLREALRLARDCARGNPMNSLTLDILNKDMILKCEMSVSVNDYVNTGSG